MPERKSTKGSWGEIFRDGHGLYSALVIGGIAMQATQMLVIAIIMPTIVADIGGAAYYTWAAMLYTIGAIVGASSTGVVWSRFGPRKGYALGAGIFAVSTACCALAPDIGALIAARAAQGWAGGVMVPFMLLFTWLAYAKIPDRLDTEAERRRFPGLPMLRLATLTAGVFCVAATGPLTSASLRLLLIVAAVMLVALTFRLDREAANNLFPPNALSLSAPIGLALWILAFHGMIQTSVSLFLPLLLQVVHGVSPIFINFLSIVISLGWSIATFSVSGWSGARERLALLSGPLIAFSGLVGLTLSALLPGLAMLTVSAFVMGIGIGIYNVHLVARAMESAAPGEQRSTASALTSVRSLGTAFGSAIAGVVAHAAGLGDATEPAAVGHAVTAVYLFCWIPFGLNAVLMIRFLRVSLPKPAAIPATAE